MQTTRLFNSNHAAPLASHCPAPNATLSAFSCMCSEAACFSRLLPGSDEVVSVFVFDAAADTAAHELDAARNMIKKMKTCR